jgi:tetratricopeptide (TPR) repeat protein
MMITRYRNWQAQKKLRAKQAATDYIFKDPKGQEELSSAVTLLKQQIKARNAVVPTADIVSKAKSTLIAQHSKTILANEDDPTRKAIEAAFRYLVKSYEILVVAHGQIHPSVGTACLAVASVQSIVGNYQVAREWLVRGLRSLERLDPLPVRAVAFVQTQLSQVLSKQGHNDEALRVLDKAARFHLAHAKEKLANSQVYSGGFVTTPPVLKGASLYDEAMLAIELTSRLVVLSRRVRNLWAAAEQAEVAAELAEATFGWDSALVCDKRKEVRGATSPSSSYTSPLHFLTLHFFLLPTHLLLQAGDCYAATGAWDKAHGSYARAYESCVAVYGKTDKQTMDCAKLSVAAHGQMQGLSDGGGGDYEEDYEAAAAEEDEDFQVGGEEKADGSAWEGRSSSPASELTLSPQPPAQGRKR